MRLTLRTLLAYLDDTLDAGEIKTIGQKVAESDTAQELVARIKQVTRRRRLTTPGDGGQGERFDANRVAAYLDNELTGEEIAELEKLCIESDVHLAEIAATHQILTLVLGEPALLPPTAKRRMYALAQGRPKKSAEKPPSVTKAVAQDGSAPHEIDADDTLLALPLFRKAPWLRWALPLAALVLLGVLGVVLWNNLGGPTDNRASRDKPENEKENDEKEKKKPTDSSKPADKKTDDSPKPTDKDKQPPDKDKQPPDKDKQPPDKDKKPDDKSKMPPDNIKVIPVVGKPSMERHPGGMFDSKEQVLVQRGPDSWKRIGLGDQVQTGEPLISLPGYKSEVKLDSKVNLLLWGNLHELFPSFLQESAVTLHHNQTAGIDAEMTLHRGRVYLTNRKDKGEARVRVHFWREESWDVILEEPDTTVGIELVSYPLELLARQGLKIQAGEEPFVRVFLYVLRGAASMKVDRRTFGDLRGPVGRAMFDWDNKGQGLSGPHSIDRKIVEFDLEQPLPMDARELNLAKRVNVALTELARTITRPEKRVEVALLESMDDKDPERRMLGIRSLVAIDEVGALLDVLAREEIGKEDVRREALIGLKTWLSRGLEQGAKLYDRKTMTGLLKDKDLSNLEAQVVLELLNGFTPEQRREKETYEVLILNLRHRKMLVRDLAWRQLEYLAPGLKIDYHPAAPPEARERGADLWKKLLDTGKLPPPPPPMPPK